MTCRRHCWVWAIVGTRRLICCAHCDEVKRDDAVTAGDGQRSDQSMQAHAMRCGRSLIWQVEEVA